MLDCLIAFGSNQGNRLEIFQIALEKLQQTSQVRVVASSEPLETKPVGGPEDQDGYLNAAIRVETDLSPEGLHDRLVEIENQLGRRRRTRWGARRIDLDLLLFGQLTIRTADLIVPHPRMSFRRFVMQPASRIAGDMIHPPSGLTIKQLNARLKDCDDLILCAYDDEFELFFDQMSAQIQVQHPSWSFRMLDRLDQWRESALLAKLVAYFPLDSRSAEVDVTAGDPPTDSCDPPIHGASTFPGATLELPRDAGQAAIEILAAIEAMKP